MIPYEPTLVFYVTNVSSLRLFMCNYSFKCEFLWILCVIHDTMIFSYMTPQEEYHLVGTARPFTICTFFFSFFQMGLCAGIMFNILHVFITYTRNPLPLILMVRLIVLHVFSPLVSSIILSILFLVTAWSIDASGIRSTTSFFQLTSQNTLQSHECSTTGEFYYDRLCT